MKSRTAQLFNQFADADYSLPNRYGLMITIKIDGGAEMSFEPANVVSPTGVIHTGFGFDVIETLPPRARGLLRKLRQRSNDAHRVIPEFADIHDLSTQKMQAEARLRQLLQPRADGGFHLPEEDARVIEQQKLVAKLDDELQRLKTLDAERSETWRIASQLTASVESFLRGGRPPGTTLEDHDGDVPKLIKNETIIDGIERLRRRGRELRADLSRVRSAPYPSSYVRTKIKAEVLALAQAGAPIVSDVIEHDRSVVWPMRDLRAGIVSAEVPSFAATETVDALGLIAFMFKDQMIAALDKLVTEEADDPASLSHDERQRQQSVVMGDLLAVERDEAALTWQALNQRLPVEQPRLDLVANFQTRSFLRSGGVSPEHRPLFPIHQPKSRSTHLRSYNLALCTRCDSRHTYALSRAR